jgi:hypothetical protein
LIGFRGDFTELGELRALAQEINEGDEVKTCAYAVSHPAYSSTSDGSSLPLRHAPIRAFVRFRFFAGFFGAFCIVSRVAWTSGFRFTKIFASFFPGGPPRSGVGRERGPGLAVVG